MQESTQKFHIAFFNRSYYPDTSATGQLLTELCESLVAEYDCRVSVVAGTPLLVAAPTQSHALSRRNTHKGVEILWARGTRFSKAKLAGRFSNYVRYFFSACLKGLLLDRPQVVVCLTDPPIIGLAGFLASRRFGCPLVMAYNDVFPEVVRLLEDFNSPLVNAVLESVNRCLASRADRVVVLGSTMKRRLIEKGAPEDHISVIPSWADCDQIYPSSKENPFSIEHGVLDKFVVMHSGNIGLSQGLEVVIEAAADLQDYSDIHILLVGDGVQKASLQARAAEIGLSNVTFLPFQPKYALIHSFAAADVFVVTLKEGLAGYIVPSKMYGILAAGRPYVASVEDETEIAEITRKYSCGLLARLGDGRDLAQQILRLYRNPNLGHQMGERARQAGLLYDRPVQVKAYYERLHGLVAEREAVLPTPLLKRLFEVTPLLWTVYGFRIKPHLSASIHS